MVMDIDDFRSYALNAGYIKSSNFQMRIKSLPKGLDGGKNKNSEFATTMRNQIYTIEATNLPGVSLATDEVRRYGIGNFEKKPYVPIFADVNIRVHVDSKGTIYDFFQSWMKLIINYDVRKGFNTTETSVGRNKQQPYELSYKEDYQTDIEIICFDPMGKESIKINLVEAYPIFIGDIPLSWDNVNTVIKLPVTLTFRDWYQEREISSDNTNSATNRNFSTLPATTSRTR